MEGYVVAVVLCGPDEISHSVVKPFAKGHCHFKPKTTVSIMESLSKTGRSLSPAAVAVESLI